MPQRVAWMKGSRLLGRSGVFDPPRTIGHIPAVGKLQSNWRYSDHLFSRESWVIQ